MRGILNKRLKICSLRHLHLLQLMHLINEQSTCSLVVWENIGLTFKFLTQINNNFVLIFYIKHAGIYILLYLPDSLHFSYQPITWCSRGQNKNLYLLVQSNNSYPIVLCIHAIIWNTETICSGNIFLSKRLRY